MGTTVFRVGTGPQEREPNLIGNCTVLGVEPVRTETVKVKRGIEKEREGVKKHQRSHDKGKDEGCVSKTLKGRRSLTDVELCVPV